MKRLFPLSHRPAIRPAAHVNTKRRPRRCWRRKGVRRG